MLLNPLDAAAPTVDLVFNAAVQELDGMWSAAIRGIPIINIPGAVVPADESANAS